MTLRLANWLMLLGVLLCGAMPANVQAAVDISLSASIAPAGPLRPGSVAIITLTFHNAGPDVATNVSAVSSDYPFLVSGLFDLNESAPSVCEVQYDDFIAPPGQPSALVAIVRAGTLASGASQVCTLALYVYPDAIGSFELSLRAQSTFGTIDLNTANNLVALPLVFAHASPQQIPAGGLGGLLALSLLIVGGARRRNVMKAMNVLAPR